MGPRVQPKVAFRTGRRDDRMVHSGFVGELEPNGIYCSLTESEVGLQEFCGVRERHG